MILFLRFFFFFIAQALSTCQKKFFFIVIQRLLGNLGPDAFFYLKEILCQSFTSGVQNDIVNK